MSKEKENDYEEFVYSPPSKVSKQDPVILNHLEVKVYDSYDRAIKTFRAMVQKEKIISDYKKKQTYEKPSDKKRREHNEHLKKVAEMEIKERKILSGEYDKEKERKLKAKELKKLNRQRDSDLNLTDEELYVGK